MYSSISDDGNVVTQHKLISPSYSNIFSIHRGLIPIVKFGPFKLTNSCLGTSFDGDIQGFDNSLGLYKYEEGYWAKSGDVIGAPADKYLRLTTGAASSKMIFNLAAGDQPISAFKIVIEGTSNSSNGSLQIRYKTSSNPTPVTITSLDFTDKLTTKHIQLPVTGINWYPYDKVLNVEIVPTSGTVDLGVVLAAPINSYCELSVVDPVLGVKEQWNLNGRTSKVDYDWHGVPWLSYDKDDNIINIQTTRVK